MHSSPFTKVTCTIGTTLGLDRAEPRLPGITHTYQSVTKTSCQVARLVYKFQMFLSEVVEHACSITSLQLGETLPSITQDMDMYSYRFPLGVCAGIAP